MNAMDDWREGGQRPQPSPSAESAIPMCWGAHVEHYPLHMRFRDPVDEAHFLPYFGTLRMENDVYWGMMSALMVTRAFILLYYEGAVGAAAAAAVVTSLWLPSAAIVYLTLWRPGIYLELRTWLLLAIRVQRTLVFLTFVSLPGVPVIKWLRFFPADSIGHTLAPVFFYCISCVAMCGFQCPGVWNAVAGGVLMVVPVVRLVRRCQPLATAAADATRRSLLQRLTTEAKGATGGLMPLTLSAGTPGPTPAPCTQINLALVLTAGFMFPMLICYAIEERCRLDFAAKRGLRVASPSRATAVAHAAALLVLSGLVFWCGLSAAAPWIDEMFDLN